MSFLVTLLAGALALLTLMPLSGSHAWWVRMWDFPRLQIAAGQAALLVAAAWLPPGLRAAVWVVTAVGLVLQLWRIRPFTPLARREMRFAPSARDGSEVKLLALNVLMENERHADVLRLLEDEDPDVLLLMETDAAWVDALAPALARYPTVLREPRDDHYGLVFATRLATEEAEVIHLTADDTPSVLARLRAPSGAGFRFVGLHPQPPVPGVDTEERDAQILYAARFAHATDEPLVVMGDFNDAAWSDTAQLFKRYGRYLDPRVGRGLYASFHADNPLIRCAIDQLYLTEEVAVVDFRLGRKVGSDHFPVIARVRVGDGVAAGLNIVPPPLTDEERADLGGRVASYAEELARGRATHPAEDPPPAPGP